MGKEPYSFTHSTKPYLFGSDDPSMIKESEVLLSQFMQGPSNEAKDSSSQKVPNQSPLQDVSIRNTRNGRMPENTSKCRQNLPDNQVASPSLRPRKKSPLTQISVPRNKDSQAQSDGGRIRIPRGNIQLRPQRNLSILSGSKHTPSNLGLSGNETVALPPIRDKRKSPPRRQSPKLSPSPSQDVSKAASVRRSGRSRTGPSNYYRKIKLFDSGSEEEVEVVGSNPLAKSNYSQNHEHSTPPAPATEMPRRKRCHLRMLDTLLQQRELGYGVYPRVHSNITSDYKLTKSWKGASNDIIALVWSPDGTRFAAGAAAQCDEHNMQYNRKNNLILGDLVRNRLYEMPDHWVPRPLDTRNRIVSDPRLFMSVTSVQWFENTLYTASYDRTVKLWDVSKAAPTCYQTLQHDSNVVVMARSNFNENILATGTRTIGLWDIKKSQFTALDLPRARSRKELELVPTSLAWGNHPAMKNVLLAGMSEKDDDGTADSGLLAAWQVGEAETTPLHFTPNSQNIFDIKWHPVLPIFATASSAGQLTSRDTRSVVNVYEPRKLKTRTMEFECPALDMNEVTFCQLNPNYVTASCTDGVTYVWDQRKYGEVLHRLEHGESLSQLDETLPREQADVGVNLQLWGDRMDQFYTGASDGVLKRWDILRSPEDVHVQDVACLREEIMRGAFSDDKSNLLIGGALGGIHILSTGPFSTDEDLSIQFQESAYLDEPESDPESGVKTAKEMLSSGELEQHPIFGPGKGPNYKGPFAAWARPEGITPEQIAHTPLTEETEIRQLSGVPPQYRKGISERHRKEVEGCILLSRIRNQKHGENKRRKAKQTGLQTLAFGNGSFVVCSNDDQGYGIALGSGDDDDDHEILPWNKRRRAARQEAPPGYLITNVVSDTIDLTGDTESEGGAGESPELRPEEDWTLEDDLEDDFWWPGPTFTRQ